MTMYLSFNDSSVMMPSLETPTSNLSFIKDTMIERKTETVERGI